MFIDWKSLSSCLILPICDLQWNLNFLVKFVDFFPFMNGNDKK